MKYKSRKTSKRFIQKCTKHKQQYVGTLDDVTRHNPSFVHFLIPDYLVNLVPSLSSPAPARTRFIISTWSSTFGVRSAKADKHTTC